MIGFQTSLSFEKIQTKQPPKKTQLLIWLINELWTENQRVSHFMLDKKLGKIQFHK